ncbi:hypothetical protein BDD12DRAFT_871933 [Trichophaea hybrida]|nr:hypothetical protein BDD12DRAFT_871933 [Trichophaea hybrida]
MSTPSSSSSAPPHKESHPCTKCGSCHWLVAGIKLDQAETSDQKMSVSSLFQSGLSSKQLDKQAIFERLQKSNIEQEIANSASTEQQVDSQTTTDYGSLHSGVSTIPIQTNYGSFSMDIPTTPT